MRKYPKYLVSSDVGGARVNLHHGYRPRKSWMAVAAEEYLRANKVEEDRKRKVEEHE